MCIKGWCSPRCSTLMPVSPPVGLVCYRNSNNVQNWPSLTPDRLTGGPTHSFWRCHLCVMPAGARCGWTAPRFVQCPAGSPPACSGTSTRCVCQWRCAGERCPSWSCASVSACGHCERTGLPQTEEVGGGEEAVEGALGQQAVEEEVCWRSCHLESGGTNQEDVWAAVMELHLQHHPLAMRQTSNVQWISKISERQDPEELIQLWVKRKANIIQNKAKVWIYHSSNSFPAINPFTRGRQWVRTVPCSRAAPHEPVSCNTIFLRTGTDTTNNKVC